MDRHIIKNTPENSGEGDVINLAFEKANLNFEYLFNKVGMLDGRFELEFTTGGNIEEGDEKKFLISSGNITIPLSSVDDFENGMYVQGITVGNDIEILSDSGINILSNDDMRTLTENTAFALVKVDSTSWVIIGNLT